MRQLLLFLFFMGIVTSVQAQDDPEYRMEIGMGAGINGYLGDFNGNLTRELQPMFSVLARYNFNPYMGLKAQAYRGTLSGSSHQLKTNYPDFRTEDYAFKGTLWSLDLTYEYNFWPYGTGRDYRGAQRLTPFIYGGLGATYVTMPQHHTATFNVPIGLGLKYKISERVNLGLEWAIHLTPSDRLDGIKDPYHINSSGLFKNTDCFSTLQLTLTYSFMKKCVTCNKE